MAVPAQRRQRRYDTYGNVAYQPQQVSEPARSGVQRAGQEVQPVRRPRVQPRTRTIVRPQVAVRPQGAVAPFAILGLLAVAVCALLVVMTSAQLAMVNDETVDLRATLSDLEAEERTYRKILVCRPNAQFDQDIGFLPGSEQEKISPLLRPIVDNLEILLDLDSKKEKRTEEELRSRIDYLFTTGVITAEAMNFMRGRSITDTWLMIDEAQNLTPRQVKGIITRVGRGTKVILLGDPAQIDHPLLDEQSNGLSYAADRMRGSPLCVQLTMLPDECERSELALDAAMRM